MKFKLLTPLAILPFFSAQSAADVIDDIYLSASYSSVSYDISDAERKSIQDDFSDIGSQVS